MKGGTAARKPRKPPERSSGTQAFERAVAVLRVVAAQTDGVRLADVVSETGLKKATVHRLLRAMQREGFVDQDERERTYQLGPEVLTLGASAAARFSIKKTAEPGLIRISADSEDSAYLSVPRGADSVILERLEGTYPIRTQVFQVGIRYPLGIGAGSLAMLAAMTDDEIEQIVHANEKRVAIEFPQFSTSILRKLIKETRARGFAINEGMVLSGSWGVGVAVTDWKRRPIAALSVGAIESRLRGNRQAEIGRLLQREATALSQRLAEER